MDKSDHQLQYFTWADRFGGSYRQPESHLDPLLEVKALDNKKDWGSISIPTLYMHDPVVWSSWITRVYLSRLIFEFNIFYANGCQWVWIFRWARAQGGGKSAKQRIRVCMTFTAQCWQNIGNGVRRGLELLKEPRSKDIYVAPCLLPLLRRAWWF